MDITFVKVVISACLGRDVADPWILFRFRETFQEAFRSAAGCEEESCGRCRGEDECPYRSIFSQSLSSDPATVRRHQKPPLPFAFQFPVLPVVPNEGARFEVGLTLVGGAVMHGNLFLSALKNCFGGQDGDFSPIRIQKVETVGYFGERSPWPFEGDAAPRLLSSAGLLATGVFGDRMRLALLTPLKLMQEGRPQRTFSFPKFFRPLMRRVTSLAVSYGDGDVTGDFRWLSGECERVGVGGASMEWVEWRRGTIGGVMGEAVLSGVREEFLPFLLFGQYLNLGKGAAFGLGQFAVQPLSS